MAGVRENTITNIASGGIASFKSVGEVPLKSLKINFNPIQEGDGDPSPSNIRPISGWTGLNVYRNRKNLFNTEIVKGAVTASNGAITVYSQGDRNRLVSYYVEIPAGTYTISCKENKQINAYFYTEPSQLGYIYSERLQTWEDMPRTFTITGRRFIAFVFRNSDNSNISPSDMTEVQLELGSNATTYEPYNSSTIPVSWSDLGTVYGGYVDLISGEGEITHILMIDTWGNWGTVADQGDGTELRYKKFPYPVKGNSPSNFNTCLCNVAPYSYGNENGTTHFYVVGSSYNCRIYLPSGTDTNLQIQALGELVTPISFSFTPIEIKTLLGQNNIWSNADTVEAQYCTLESLDIYKQRFKTNEPHLQSVSGSIANFQTDMVAPLKECKVYFEPVQASGTPSPNNVLPISGWNSLEVYRTSKNIRNWTITDSTIPLDYGGGQSQFNGFSNGCWDNYWIISDNLIGKTLTYSTEIVRAENPTNEYAEVRCWTYTSSGEFVQLFLPSSSQRCYTGNRRSTLTFTVPENVGRLGLGIVAGRGDRFYNPIISIGNTEIPYEPYNGSTESITLPSTYYGGYADIAKGALIQDWGYVDLGDLNWYKSTITGDYQVFVSTALENLIDRAFYVKNQHSVLWYCSHFISITCKTQTGMRQNVSENNVITITQSGTSGDICVRYDDCDTAEEFKAAVTGVQLAYSHLLNPVEHSLTPSQIKTLKGLNNIWSNTNGVTEVKYWTHGSIADKRKVVWNQRMKQLNSTNYSKYISGYSNVTFLDGIASFEWTDTVVSYRPAIKNNTLFTTNKEDIIYTSYMLKHDGNVTTWGSEILGIQQSIVKIPSNEWTRIAFLTTASKVYSNNTTFIFPEARGTGVLGMTCQVKIPLCVNLTQMFGAGNEPSSAAEFEALCTRNGIDLTQPQPYDEGTEVEWYF